MQIVSSFAESRFKIDLQTEIDDTWIQGMVDHIICRMSSNLQHFKKQTEPVPFEKNFNRYIV